MSLKRQLLTTAQCLAGLARTEDLDYQRVLEKELAKLLSGIESIQEIDGNTITADKPWAFEVKRGTCFAGRFFIEDRISPKKEFYRARQLLWKNNSNEICHHVIVKCTRIERDAEAEEIKRILEYEERSIDAIGVQANCSPYSIELIDAGVLKTPEGKPVLLWQAFEEMQGDAKLLARNLGGTLPPFLVMRLAAQMAEALTVYHAEGIVHRDIKPHNILFDQPKREELALLCTNFKLGDA
jgi:serine/threonine protein kinase